MLKEHVILVLNMGSTSLKLSTINWDATMELTIQEIGWTDSIGKEAALRRLGEALKAFDHQHIAAVGHRIVHGGPHFTRPVLIDAAIEDDLHRLAVLAPLHNPRALLGVDTARLLFPNIPHVAAFDTMFHASLAPEAYLYAVPYEWYTNWGIRRFGFHGLSYQGATRRVAEILGLPVTSLRLVICHLGGGCSVAAIHNGRSVETTMGYTPLEGVPMATRSGSIDPGIILALLRRGLLSVEELEDELEQRSGIAGVAGGTGDMQQLLQAVRAGDERARLARDIFCHRVSMAIGAMAVAARGLDVLVWTGGIGEHAAGIRDLICRELAWMGIALDSVANELMEGDRIISPKGSTPAVVVLRAREDLEVAQAVRQVLDEEC
jgi:acetate kinase